MKVTKASFEKKIAELTDQVDELRKAVNGAKVAVKAGEILTSSGGNSGEQKPAEQKPAEQKPAEKPAASNDNKSGAATPAEQKPQATTQESADKKKGSKILDVIKTADYC